MTKIKITRNTNGDTRVATKVPTFREFECANLNHIEDVKSVMVRMARELEIISRKHDDTKVVEPYRSMFYRDLCNTIEGKMNFLDGEWSKLHYESERHHLLKRVPVDVNLFDVLEMVADCVSAGMARSGEVRPLEIDEATLSKALHNTVDLVASWIELSEEE